MYGISSYRKQSHNAMESHEDAAAISGQMQDKRSVQQQQAVIQLSDQMATVSVADQQSSSRHAPEKAYPPTARQLAKKCKQEARDAIMHIAEMTNAMKPDLSGSGIQCKPEPVENVERDLCEAFPSSGINEDVLTNDTALSLCFTIVKEAGKCIRDLLDVMVTAGEPEASEEADDSDDSDDLDLERPRIGNKLEASKTCQRAVLESLERLEMNKEIWKQHDPWLLYRAIGNEVMSLNNMSFNEGTKIHRHNTAFIMTIINPVYSIVSGKILEDMKQHMDAGCGWEYIKSFVNLFHPQLLTGSFKSDHIATYVDVVKQIIDTELKYLQFLATLDFPPEFAVNHTSNIIEHALHDLYTRSTLHFAYGYCGYSDSIKMNLRGLREVTAQKRDECSDRNKEKTFRELEEKVRCGIADTFDKRLYTDVLGWRLVLIIQQHKGPCLDVRESARLLEDLAGFSVQHAEHISTSRALHQDLKIVISHAARQILLAISDHDHSDELEKSLILIGSLDEKGYLDEECKELYLDCRQPQPGTVMTATGATARAGRMTEHQCKQRIDRIFAYMDDCHSECGYLVAADQIKQLKDAQIIETLDDAAMLNHAISRIETQIVKTTFDAIIRDFSDLAIKNEQMAFNRNKDKNKTDFFPNIDDRMNRHKPEFIQLRPFMFLLYDQVRRESWQQAACSAWHKDVMRMSQAETFSKEDIDQLLCLKEIAPTVPDSVVRSLLRSALANLFMFVKKQERKTSDASMSLDAEEIRALRDWANDLKPDQSSWAILPSIFKIPFFHKSTSAEAKQPLPGKK